MTAPMYFDIEGLGTHTIQSWCELVAKEVNAGSFWQRLRQVAQSVARDHIKPAINQECATRYDEQHWEYLIWAVGLVCAAWTLEIFRLKTRNGHCHTHSLLCSRGAQFHAQLHENVLKSFEKLVDVANNMPIISVEE